MDDVDDDFGKGHYLDYYLWDESHCEEINQYSVFVREDGVVIPSFDLAEENNG